MEKITGDPTHAAKEIENNLDTQSAHEILVSVGQEKPGPDRESSGSNSDNAPGLEKLDSQLVKVDDVKDEDEAYAHLPPDEREIVKKQLHVPEVKVTYTSLYRYATRTDIIILFISSICAIVGGTAMPLMTVSPRPSAGNPVDLISD